MLNRRLFGSLVVLCTSFSWSALGQDQSKTATVHLRVVLEANGMDLGTAKVEKFQREHGYMPSANFADRFKGKMASGIPYDFYTLCAHAAGFWTACTEVPVYQSEVWVVLGLRLGTESGPGTDTVTGRVSGKVDATSPLWVKLKGVYSSVSIDAKVDKSGAFQVCVPIGRYVLITMRDDEILDTRPVSIPSSAPVLIDVPGKK
ncbi:MAG: hypothetical protein ACE145_19745 [Terriglobia bacterium]